MLKHVSHRAVTILSVAGLVALLLFTVQGTAMARRAAGDPSLLLGSQTVAANSDTSQGSASEAFGFTASQSGTATSVNVYLVSTDGVQIGLYTDSASHPGTRLDHASITSNVAGWSTVSLTGNVPIVSGTRYWIALGSTGGSATVTYRDQGNSGSNLDFSGTGFASPYSSNGQWTSNPVSAYVSGNTTIPTTTVPVASTTLPGSTTTVPVTTTTVPVTTTTIPATTTTIPIPPGNCSFRLTSNNPAFCETFDQNEHVAGTRSGQMNGTLWGLSHASNFNNEGTGQSYGWPASSQASPCGTSTVAPENDVTICNGQMIESANDGGSQTLLAAYPRQPFDFAGRTGTVEFDVSDNTQGAHASWPAFAITDQPVPAPYDNALSGVSDTARNSVGVTFARSSLNDPFCAGYPSSSGIGVDTIYETVNYRVVNVNMHQDSCVKTSTQVGMNNHVEIQVSSSGMHVYMSDAGQPATLKLVADASFSTAPLTRGLIWLEDAHYNANKFNSQQTNTFSWDNVAFDGPVLPRDLGFDILDNTKADGHAENGLPLTDLGYIIPNGGRTLTLTVPNVTGTANAAAALLELTYWPEATQTLTYSINGNPSHQFAWPGFMGGSDGGPTFASQTVAMPVPLSEVHDGSNTITLSTSDTSNGVTVANFDLILAGAGGVVQP